MADLVRSDVEAYAAAHTTALPPWLQRVHAEAVAELPYPSMLSGPVVGRLLETLVFALRPQLVVEVGTYAGYSALAMAGALPPGGRLVTLELNEVHADFAQRHVDASPYADRIEIVRGPALASLDRLDGPFDMVFIDADKTGYPDYYEAALAKLSPGGLIVVDNTLHDGGVLDPSDEGDRTIAALNDRWASDERVVATQLTVRDGLTLLRRR
ncbi:MAG TPA: O-methyltransferase [Baekduia sp.]|nr:O-methyltransferase [Baekduia sp.]